MIADTDGNEGAFQKHLQRQMASFSEARSARKSTVASSRVPPPGVD